MHPFLLVAVVMGTSRVTAVIHSLTYFHTASSQVLNLPEFVSVGLVDEVQMIHYDSNTRRAEPKQDWMDKVSADDPEFWLWETQNFLEDQDHFKDNIEIAKQRFNQTGGVHTYQGMYGCEWNNETGEENGFNQEAFDGEDFISFDLKTLTWNASRPQAFRTKQKLDDDKVYNEYWKHKLTRVCPERLKKYLNYGRSSLLRTELPRVSLLQKTPSSPVSCHATCFFPREAMLFWRKDGQKVPQESGEILPNTDGTFQMSADLKLPDTPGDLREYQCVFQLSGVKEDVVTVLDRDAIRSNAKNGIILPVAVVVLIVVPLLVLVAVGYVFYKKMSAKAPPPPKNSEDVPLRGQDSNPAPCPEEQTQCCTRLPGELWKWPKKGDVVFSPAENLESGVEQ